MTIRFKPDWYLVLIIAMVALASVVTARGNAASILDWVTRIGIALVFFLHGAKLSREAVLKGLTHWRLHLIVLASTYGLFPLLAVGFAALPGWITPPVLVEGIVFLGCLPSTIQSSIGFTAIARGNMAAAVAAASASNLLGVLITPLLVGLLLHGAGAISLGQVQSIVLQLLVPFAAGQLLRRWIAPAIGAHGRLVQYVDRGSILLVVYTAFSAAVVAGVWHRLDAFDLVRLVLICGALLAIVLAATVFAARAFRFDTADEVAIVFCGSKKSLASGVPMASVLFPNAVGGVALLPLMVFHQIQLMVCAVIAQKYASRVEGPPPA